MGHTTRFKSVFLFSSRVTPPGLSLSFCSARRRHLASPVLAKLPSHRSRRPTGLPPQPQQFPLAFLAVYDQRLWSEFSFSLALFVHSTLPVLPCCSPGRSPIRNLGTRVVAVVPQPSANLSHQQTPPASMNHKLRGYNSKYMQHR